MNKVSVSALALIATLSAGLMACTDDDVSGGAYVANDAVIYGDSYYNHGYDYPGYYPAPVIIVPGGGGYHGGGHGGGFGGGHGGPGGGFGGGPHGGPGGFGGGPHGGPGGFGGGHGGPGGGGHGGHPIADVTTNPALTNAFNTVAATGSFQSTDSRVQSVAARYEISDYAATYIVRAIVLAQGKDLSGLQAIGLDTNDFSDLYNGRELSTDKISVVAASLKMPVVAAQSLVQDMQTDIQAQQKKSANN